MKTYANPYTQKIFLIISPLIGEMMAVGILKAQTQKLGVNEDFVTSQHIPQLAAEIKRGLVIFLGTDVAAQVSKKITEIE